VDWIFFKIMTETILSPCKVRSKPTEPAKVLGLLTFVQLK